jgi:beta-glucosidase
LKNENSLLPLDLSKHKKIAFIGPNAGASMAAGGGSANLLAHYKTTPKDSFIERVKEDSSIQVSYAEGYLPHRYLPLVDPSIMVDPKTNTPGFNLEFWTNIEHQGNVELSEHRPSSHLICYDGLPPSLTTGERYSYRGTTIITPKTTGMHTFSLSTCGPGKLILDGEVLISIYRDTKSPKSPLFQSYGSPEERVQKLLVGGQSYKLELESISREPAYQEFTYHGDMLREEIMDGGRIGFMEEVKEDLFENAVTLAKESDVVVLVVGRSYEWETESWDILSLNLPLRGDELVSRVLEVNLNTIVVTQTGGPVAMPWINEAPAVVQVS